MGPYFFLEQVPIETAMKKKIMRIPFPFPCCSLVDRIDLLLEVVVR
jgi:hypothetical protein